MKRTGYSFIRITFCTLNVIVWLAGCTILGVGIWLYLAYGGYATLLPSYSAFSADSLCIATGVITFVIAFLGCCGSWFQNRCLLVSYFLLVMLMFSFEFTAGTLAYIYKDNLSEMLKEEFRDGVRKHYRASDEQGFTDSWDHIQQEFRCCGVINYTDWFHNTIWPKQQWVPDSCCNQDVDNRTGCGRLKLGIASHIYQKGCLDRLHIWFLERMHIFGLIVLVFSFVQLFGLISSMLICCTLRQRRRRKLLGLRS